MPRRNLSPLSPSAAARPLPDVAALARFRPTSLQRQFVQLAVEGDAPLRVSAVCAELGIARSTYYRWLDDSGFRAWMALQWASVLMADGGRLLSIARCRAETDFRYWKALVELIFDPRGLGLLAVWQQRMAALPEPEAPHAGDDVQEEAEDGGRENIEAGGECDSRAPLASGDEDAPEALPDGPEETAAPATCVASPALVESITSAPSTQQNAPSAAPPAPYIPHFPPPWPNGGPRFHF